MKTIKYLTLFLLIALLGSSSNALNNGDDSLQIYKYKVKAWENTASVAEKFNLTEYTLRVCNNIYYRDLWKGQIVLVPNKNVIIFKLPNAYWNIRRVALKFYVKDKSIIIFDYRFVKVKVDDFHQKIPKGYYAAVPQNHESRFSWPTQGGFNVISGYGPRRNPFNRRLAEYHTGLDIPLPYKKIKAAKSGRVYVSGWLYGYGRCIIIEHNSKEKTLYAHLNRIFVRRGAYVKQGMVIAQSGNTGRSTGAHLHFEIRIKDIPVNPWKYFREDENEVSTM
jgi:hypothetical protein